MPLPKPNGDFYQVTESLDDSEGAISQKVRTFMESTVAPVVNKYWLEDSFPFDLVPGFRDLGVAGMGYHGYGCAGGSTQKSVVSTLLLVSQPNKRSRNSLLWTRPVRTTVKRRFALRYPTDCDNTS